MRKLLFKTNTNISLLHFIDFASQWHFRTGKDTRNYFVSSYGETETDKKMFNHYASYRKVFGHEAETELLEWAYQNFPFHKDFTPLHESIMYFAKRSNGKTTVLQELEAHNANISEWKVNLEKEVLEIDLESIIIKMSFLFNNLVTKTSSIYAYLVAGVTERRRGGANGEGIYVEILNPEKGNPIAVVAHEYFHKTVSPHLFYEGLNDPYYEGTKEDIYLNDFASFVEEVITYATVNVILFGQNIIKTKKMYSEIITDEADRKRMLLMWDTIENVVPVIKNYLDNGNKDITIKELDTIFRNIKSN